MELLSVLVGISLTLWLCTILAVAYILWRYSFAPWRSMRVDIKALDTKIEEVRQLSAIRRAEVMSDQEAAFIEERLRARSAARSSQGLG